MLFDLNLVEGKYECFRLPNFSMLVININYTQCGVWQILILSFSGALDGLETNTTISLASTWKRNPWFYIEFRQNSATNLTTSQAGAVEFEFHRFQIS